MTSLPARAHITESSPRDGLQSLAATISTEDKVGLIEGLAQSGLTAFDAVSFVNPKAVPQMADGADVISALRGREDLQLWALVPNSKGLEIALGAGVTHIGVLTAASDTFNERNINATVDESMHRIRRILSETPAGVETRGYVSTATHCPFEGEQDPDWVAHLVETLLEWGVDHVYLGETIGKATPAHIDRLLDEVLDRSSSDQIGIHLHDTYGQAIANTVTALERGIARMDASAGGLGGCPYAPGATGNVATEDLIWLLDGLGVEHGLDAGVIAAAARDFCDDHALPYNSRAGRALLAAGEAG